MQSAFVSSPTIFPHRSPPLILSGIGRNRSHADPGCSTAATEDRFVGKRSGFQTLAATTLGQAMYPIRSRMLIAAVHNE